MQNHTVDVCVVEDDASQRTLLLRQLLDAQYSVVQAETGREGLEQIRRHHPRVVVCDLLLPEMNAIELCRQVRADPILDGTYIIIVTAHDSRERKHEALNASADDYLVKPYDMQELTARLRNGLRVSRLQERLRQAALTDSLTELWNHSQFRALLDREFARTRRYGGLASLLMIDLDHFKAINDTYGHETGNRVLRCVAGHLTRMVRDIDIVARYGGEEFAVICPHTGLDEATRLAERIRHTLPLEVRVPSCAHLNVTASIGAVCTSDPRVGSVTDLINLGDQALYTGKRRGRNQVVRCDDLLEPLLDYGLRVGEVDRLQKQVVALSMQAKDLCLQSIWALVQALEARDRFTARHSRNVTFYVERLAQAAGWPENLRAAAAHAAMLHDLGKIGVPDHILQKPGSLTPDEAAALRQVPLLTCKILEPLRIFETEIVIVRHIRERYDGTGYPDGLHGANIPLGARLLAIAETFDALTSSRAHRPHRTIEAAVAEILAESGKHFDPQFAELLRQTLRAEENLWRGRVDQTRAELETTAISALP